MKIEYNGIVLFDGPVEEVIWNDGENGVAVTGKVKKQGGGGSFLDILAAASKKNTQAAADEKRKNYEAEASVVETEEVAGVAEEVS